MEKTFFISFEGIDGCGKDTQLHRLIETIRQDDNKPFGNKYSNIWVTREPTKITPAGTKISNLIREIQVTGEQATQLYVEDRKEHTKIIKQILEHSHVLISRYDLSTLSYQMTQGIEFDYLYKLHKFNQEEGCIIPDITIVFDLDVKTAFERMGNRNSVEECFEKIEFQEKLQNNLKYAIEELRKRDNRKIIIIDASKSIEEVTNEMIQKIENVINLKNENKN